jgi:hypothetical protein
MLQPAVVLVAFGISGDLATEMTSRASRPPARSSRWSGSPT